MPSLRKDLRNDLEKAILKAREIAEAGAREALAALAVGEAKPFNHLSAKDKALRKQLRARGRQAGDILDERTDKQTTTHLESIVAYEHWHRMLFARFLAENGCLLEPEHQVPVSLADVDELARDEKVDVWELAGRFAQRMLPQVFRADDPVLAVSIARESRVKLEKLVADLSVEVYTASDSLGWTYQFWQTNQKDTVNKSGNKIGADELPAVTQLFTEDYMVDFLLDNTLGAWHAGKVLAANPRLAENAQSEDELRQAVALPGCPWSYLRFIKGKDSKWTPAAGTFDSWPKSAAALRALDPCMGSGHFVVAMFERIVALRLSEEKLEDAAAVAAVLRNNLFGLEIDPRCTQIGAFNLALAAWRRVGYRPLPAMNLACSGLAPNAREADWQAIAGDNEKLRNGMERLYRLFKSAPILGSLINPRASEGDLLVAAFHELQPLLEMALAQETNDDTAREMAVIARGLAKTAEILASQFTLVATNFPFLGLEKQGNELGDHLKEHFDISKRELATSFLVRSERWCGSSGTTAVVMPGEWTYARPHRHFRKWLLDICDLKILCALGNDAFATPLRVKPVLLIAGWVSGATQSLLIDVRNEIFEGKPSGCANGTTTQVNQATWKDVPDARLVSDEDFANAEKRLSDYADAKLGVGAGDGPRFEKVFWELAAIDTDWAPLLGPSPDNREYSGREAVIFWQQEKGEIYNLAQSVKHLNHAAQNWQRGRPFWGRRGLLLSQMGGFTIYSGEIFDGSCLVVMPQDISTLLPLTAYALSGALKEAISKYEDVFRIASPQSVLSAPFDLAHWQKVAAERYPHGLPKPFSSDPTQWLFNGHPAGADQPLHVAVARLLGYQWPRQTGSSFPDCPALTSDGLEDHTDEDGIVCLTALRGERAAADRVRSLLSAALGSYDEHALIAATDSKARTLENWLIDEFFAQHCQLFQQRPFIWHIWDGLEDGFHALVNYHKLAAPNGAGRKLLETLTFSYLGDWIKKQQDDIAHKKPGAEDKLVAAQALQTELKAILAGEPPYDIFVRWKPLHQQAIGWEPDINDGVRMNIRPFILATDVGRKGAGILRSKPGSIKWDKDRGKEPERPKTDFPWFWIWDEATEDFTGSSTFDGNRWNDCHYTPAAKRAARERSQKTT